MHLTYLIENKQKQEIYREVDEEKTPNQNKPNNDPLEEPPPKHPQKL